MELNVQSVRNSHLDSLERDERLYHHYHRKNQYYLKHERTGRAAAQKLDKIGRSYPLVWVHLEQQERKQRIFSELTRARRATFERRSSSDGRLFGPIQIIKNLLETWELETRDAVKLLGYEVGNQSLVNDILDGHATPEGRDFKDRVAYLIQVRSTLFSLFRDENVERKWLREPQVMLGNRTPMELLLEGSMENLLLVKEFCDEVAGM